MQSFAVHSIRRHRMLSNVFKSWPLFTVALLGPSAAAMAAPQAPQVVHVSLADATGDATMKNMVMKSDQQSIKAGPITFMVQNDSKALVHEMIVVSVTDAQAQLPYDTKADKIIESKIKHL